MLRGKKINNVAIGIFIFAGIFLFLSFIYFAGKFSFLAGGGYKIYIEYDFLDNLQSGAKVKVSGGPSIGHIADINFETGKIVIEADIDGKYKINRDANFNIYSTSMVGQKYINVSGYNPKSESGFLTNNEYVVGITPIGFARTIELAGAGVKSLMASGNTDTASSLKNVFKNTAELMEGLNHVVNDNQKDIRQSIQRLSKSMRTTGELMERINATMGNLETGSKKLSSTLNSIDDEQVRSIVTNISVITYELKTLSADLNRMTYDPNSTLSLLRDKNFRSRLDNTAKNLEDFSKKISDNPSRLFFGK